jgi:hypothetical protein
MDPALLRNIALQTNDNGEADAQLALAARRMIDRNGQVQINPDDLPASMRALGGAGAVPMWVKFSVPLSVFLTGELDPSNTAYWRVPLFTTKPGTIIHDCVVKPTEGFAGPAVDTLLLYVGVSTPAFSNIFISGPTAISYFGDGPGIENDLSYVFHAQRTNPQDVSLFPAQSLSYSGVAGIALFAKLEIDSSPGVAEDFLALTAGGLDIWLLVSVLP